MPERGMWLTTPLGEDVLELAGVTAHEAISQPFRLHLDCISTDPASVQFDRLLGQKVTVTLALPEGAKRYFNGVVSRVGQAGRTFEFTRYSLEVVPTLWLLTRKTDSRIFQQKTVIDILKQVMTGIELSFQTVRAYPQREYCVQYRETDFNFVSRLMEEEGIYYFFKHRNGGHEMVIADSPAKHPDMPEVSALIFEEVSGGSVKEDRVFRWEKSQEIRSGKVTLWDHCFQLPGQHLQADKTIAESVQVAATTHKLQLANTGLELYDYPGHYAHWFDGITPGGGESPANLQDIFQENKVAAAIRMQTEAAPSVTLHGHSGCRQLVSGHKFTLTEHFSDDDAYVMTSVEHTIRQPLGTVRGDEAFFYTNRFTCIPLATPFRPARLTPIPTVRGAQTAVVVGPSGEEIFPDKYGRVKVQFHWDREGTNDASSSCWLRVATLWAGQQWGMIHIPRIGQEVIVDFLEGNPDRPIIVGSVYNAEQMPPYALPDNKTQSGIKSRSSPQGGAANFNEIRFEDKKGQEQVYIHAEKNLDTVVENDETRDVGHDRTTTIKNHETKTVKEGNETITIKQGNQSTTIEQGNCSLLIKMGNQSTQLDMGNQDTKLKMGNQTTKLDLGKAETEAMQSIELKVGQSSIKIDQMGVTIKGMMIKIEGTIQVQVKALMVQGNADAMMQLQGGIVMIN